MIKKAFTIILFLFLIPSAVWASSQSAYQEYLIEFDKYRAVLNEFKVARSEYLKFKTLTSQQTALDKTKQMLSQRSQLLRAYLQFLNEKLNESASMDASTKSLYQTLIANEVKFLNNHTGLMGAIGSLQDAEGVSQQLSSHYTMLQSSMYQTIVGLKTAELMALDAHYYALFTKSHTLIQENTSSYTPEKQSIMERWLLQIQNKRDLFRQKYDEITKENTVLKSSSLSEITASYQRIQKLMSEARQYLSEGTSFLQELTASMQYGE
ncbi:MAG: hypothetical protein UV63_C0008G0012 [Microgenomates group bacterium GW2011_GWC1_43_11]|uniref:Uncharacterized protein n=2 Tax=Candidatus Gottesmaniibacteriota TaxID=1752720 RepID=A0A0G1IQS4_9BACT|nr:MAG: hypothetical protein UV63_C0008G0012 [Microgenomates group bacterium GW2011_GWC1_43_11]KKT39048.1 MAG: hypothetical protein UW22_C0002G0024 [Candidatus Gottesmanbacteria bacterium GW2011_GWB1_44_11c]KKT61510.1 MAG: hypothetical protein UW52_C0002G0024 [Candidatus Gottesmanbacteria bacterium GW2011_GWA1_44_24b]HCM81908.1 hypothetical protein [Patescibacteria group bacterium]